MLFFVWDEAFTRGLVPRTGLDRADIVYYFVNVLYSFGL